MGLNALAFVFRPGRLAKWPCAVFLSGVVFPILSVTGAINVLDAAMPKTLKRAVGVVSAVYRLIGLINAGIIQGSPDTVITRVILRQGYGAGLIGLLITAVLMARGAMRVDLWYLDNRCQIPMGVTQITGSIVGKLASLAPIALKWTSRAHSA